MGASHFFLFLFILVPASSLWAKDRPSCEHSKTRFNCVEYLRNYDGDTITFNIPKIHPLFGKKISIRVKGVDTPELRTKNKCEKEAGRTAKKLVKSLFKNAKRIDLVDVTRGKYFRVVADVIIDGRNLKDILLKQRLAYVYGGGTKSKKDWCEFGRLPAKVN